MAQSKKMMKSKKNSRGLKKGKNVQAVKTLKTPTLFNACANGSHIPEAKITV